MEIQFLSLSTLNRKLNKSWYRSDNESVDVRSFSQIQLLFGMLLKSDEQTQKYDYVLLSHFYAYAMILKLPLIFLNKAIINISLIWKDGCS